jgi:KUP system potassium uptake protein
MEQAMDSTQSTDTRKAFAKLALGALGVVFGDIGTSPLYTIHSTFVGENLDVTEPNVLGVLSLVFWLLVVVVSLKYVTFIMRADNRGEGGIIALMALAMTGARGSARLRRWIVIFGLLGAALFYGDGVITPAISVLSAVEGLKVVAPTLEHSIVPVTIAILVLLFMVQSRGTGKVGVVFGPIMLVWFVVIGVLGLMQIVTQPHVLYALNPIEGLSFFLRHGFHGFLALGGVVLAITGAEALYADMGHFGRKPIRIDWFGLVSFALVMNYFGQGALLLNDPGAVDNPFYHLVPDALQLPMLVLACVATIIASQAVITGAFSMTREAIQLGFSPRMEIKHTSRQMYGEIYLPWVNRALFVMVIAAVVGFKSSDNLGAAYGIAVTGTMLITSLLALVVQRLLWGWPRWIVLGLAIVGLSIDTSLFLANAVKIGEGGWFPLVLGLFVFIMMTTWRKGRDLVLRGLQTSSIALEPFVESITTHPPLRVPGTAIFLTANVHGVPSALLHNLKHNKVLHERNILLTVETLDAPTANYGERTEITALGHDFFRLIVRFGFAEDPDIPQALQSCEAKGLGFDMMDTTFFLSRESIIATDRPGMPLWRDKIFVYLVRNSSSATAFFRLPGNRLIELGTQVEI